VKRKTKSYEKIDTAIRKYDIPKSTLARLIGMWPTDLSAWLNNRLTVSFEREERIKQTVDDIVRVLKATPFRPDLRKPDAVRKMIQAVNEREAQLVSFSDGESSSTAAA